MDTFFCFLTIAGSFYNAPLFFLQEIFEILYNEELPESIDNIVYCLISSMRKKIEPELKRCRYIKTVRGVGYKFEGKKMDIFPE